VTRIRSQIISYLSGVYLREPWWAEFWSGVIAIGWAIAFIADGEPLSISAPNTFQVMEHIAPGPWWALFCVIAGIFQLGALLANARKARWAGAIIMGWFPLTAVVAMLMSSHLVPHIAVYGGWFGINLFSVFRLPRRGL
jgi:hypothetical protein